LIKSTTPNIAPANPVNFKMPDAPCITLDSPKVSATPKMNSTALISNTTPRGVTRETNQSPTSATIITTIATVRKIAPDGSIATSFGLDRFSKQQH
jgi:hypothetical protein